MAKTSNFVQTQGQAQDRTRAARGHLKDKKRLTRTYKEKPRTDLGLAKGSHRGKVQFYQFFFIFSQGNRMFQLTYLCYVVDAKLSILIK